MGGGCPYIYISINPMCLLRHGLPGTIGVPIVQSLMDPRSMMEFPTNP